MNKILLFTLLIFSSALFAQTWVTRAITLAVRHHPITFSLNGKGYAVTGTSSSNAPTNSVFDYDPVSNSWGTLPNFPGTARSFGIGAVTNGLAYIGFGATRTSYLNDLWRFDASDSSWTQLASCSCTGRRHPAMIAIGNRLYVGLGDDASGDRNDWWMYNITTNSWTRIANLPGPGRHHPFMFEVGGSVYAGLGHSGNVIYRDWYKLDTANNTWSTMTLFPGQARVAGTQFSANGYGYVLSGDGQNHSYMTTGEMWRYNYILDSWTQLTAHPGRSRWAPGSFVINNEVYFFGGLDRFSNSFPTNTVRYNLGSGLTDISEQTNGSLKTTVYPNPAHSVIYWESDLKVTEVRIYNLTGQLFTTASAESKRINVQDLSNGLYLVQFYNNAELINTSKVMIQH